MCWIAWTFPVSTRVLFLTTEGNIHVCFQFSILMWQIIRASLDDGVKEARALLHDWLVILTAQYNDYYKFAQFAQPSTSNRLDVAFSKCPQLQALPRHVFALLRSSLLRSHEEGVHPDHRIYLQCLFRYNKYTDYGIYCGPHYWACLHTKKHIEAYTVRAHYLSAQRSKLELRLFLLDWK